MTSRRLKEATARVGLRIARLRGDPIARLLGPGASENPYPLYEAVRSDAPLVRSAVGVHATATHAVAAAVLRDGRFSSSPSHVTGYRPPEYPSGDPRAELPGPGSSLLSMDPPDHTRIRRLVASAFTPRTVAALEPSVRETARRLLASVDPAAGFDLVEALAFPLPLAVICSLLGVPASDEARFRAWGHDIALTLEPSLSPRPWLEASEVALTAYLRTLIAERRACPDGTLLSRLIAVEEDGDRLSEEELVATGLLLLVAGFETTVNLIANGTVALLGEPELWDRLREEPHRWADAVEELLRYDSPVQLTSRTATEDLELAGGRLPRGSSVLVLIGGANRDPEVFDDPDRLALDRPGPARHLAFSLGIHHCLGAALARLEAAVAFEELAARVPRPVLAAPPARRPLIVLRGFDTVPLRAA